MNHTQTTDQREGVPLEEAGRRNALIADTMYGAAIAVLATGVCLHLFWQPKADSRSQVASDGGMSWTIGPNFLRLNF